MKGRVTLSMTVFIATAILLAFIQMKVENPLLLLERFFEGGGWIEVFLAAGYGALLAWQMSDPVKSARWRKNTWFLFSVVFFSQLILGLWVNELFLMSGKLHLPIPVMILSGPIYRGELSVMSILFLSTILLSGPAWCSHFCYFGALDNLASGKKRKRGNLGKIWRLKIPMLITIIAVTLVLRAFKIDLSVSTWIAIGFGLLGLAVMLVFSGKKGKMVHCLTWCPIGSMVSILKHVNPIRLRIADSCTSCMACSSYCKYDALKKEDILAQKPALSCTLCGDCITSCHAGSLQYKLFNLGAVPSRNFYLGITITLHAMTMVLARI